MDVSLLFPPELQVPVISQNFTNKLFHPYTDFSDSGSCPNAANVLCIIVSDFTSFFNDCYTISNMQCGTRGDLEIQVL